VLFEKQSAAVLSVTLSDATPFSILARYENLVCVGRLLVRREETGPGMMLNDDSEAVLAISAYEGMVL
jgi:hypothetical protein